MLKQLTKIANKLDRLGLTKEADLLDEVISKISGMSEYSMTEEGELEYPDEEAIVVNDEPSYMPGGTSHREGEYILPPVPQNSYKGSHPLGWDRLKQTSPGQARFEESMIPIGHKDVAEEEDISYYGDDTMRSILKRLEYLEDRMDEEGEEE